MIHRSYKLTGRVLAAVGVLLMLAEAGTYYYAHFATGEHYDVNVTLLLVGATLGFVGFYILDNKRALDGGRFLVQSAAGILAVVRGGAKRSGDVVIAPVDPAAPPVAPASEGVAAPAAPAPPVVPSVPDLTRIPAPEQGP